MSASSNPLASLIVKFLADSGDLDNGIKGISDKLGGLGAEFDISKITEGFAEIAAAAGIATGAFELSKEALENFSKAQDVQTSFALLTGSVNLAKVSFDGLKETAVQLAIPFESLVDVAQRLAPQFGVGTAELQAVLVAAGDAAAATGRDFQTVADGLDRIAITGQVGTRQLAQFGVSINDIATSMGVSVDKAYQLLKKGGQDAQADVDAVVAAIEAKFGGAAELIGQNLSGQLINLKNDLSFISEDLGAALAPLAGDLIAGVKDIEPILKGVVEGVSLTVDALRAMVSTLQDTGVEILKESGLLEEFGRLGGNIASLWKESGLAEAFNDISVGIQFFLGNVNLLKEAFDATFPEFAVLKLTLEGLNETLELVAGKSKDMADGQDALTKAINAAKAAADPWNTAAMQMALAQKAADDAAKHHATTLDSLAQAFKDLGAKVPPTTEELNKVADALELIKGKYEQGVIPLSTYDAAIGDFVKKMTSLQGAFQAASLPADDLGQALKAAGIQSATDAITKLQEGVAAAGAAFDIGRINASDYAKEIDKLTAAEEANATDGLKGLTTALSIAGEQYATGKIGLDAYAQALQNLVANLPTFQDAINNQNVSIGTLNAAFLALQNALPDVAAILKSFGQETVDDVTAHLATLQKQLDGANAALKVGVPGAALAAQLALAALRVEQEKLSTEALDDQKLGIPSLTTLKQKLADATAAYQDLSNRGLLNSTTALEANIAQQRLAIDVAVQQGQDTTNLRIDLDTMTDALHRQTVGLSDMAASLKQVELSGLDALFHNLIFDIGSVGDAFKKLGEDMVDVVLNRIIKDALNPLLDSLDKVIASATKALENVLGIGTAAVPAGATPPFAGGSIPGTGGSTPGIDDGTSVPGTSSAPGGAASAISSSITGLVTAISSAASAVTGIISVFQNAHQETSLNAIELNTRDTAILLGSLSADGKNPQDADNIKGWVKTIGQTLQEGLPWLVDYEHDAAVALQDSIEPNILGMWGNIQTIDANVADIKQLMASAGGPGGPIVSSSKQGLAATPADQTQFSLPDLSKVVSDLDYLSTIADKSLAFLSGISTGIAQLVASAAASLASVAASSSDAVTQLISAGLAKLDVDLGGLATLGQAAITGLDALAVIQTKSLDVFESVSISLGDLGKSAQSMIDSGLRELDSLNSIRVLLSSIDSKILPPATATKAAPMVVNFTVTASADPMATAKAVMDKLSLLSPAFG